MRGQNYKKKVEKEKKPSTFFSVSEKIITFVVLLGRGIISLFYIL